MQSGGKTHVILNKSLPSYFQEFSYIGPNTDFL